MAEAGGASRRRFSRAILHDGSLRLWADPSVAPMAAAWLPRAPASRVRAPAPARIRLREGPPPAPPVGEPAFAVLGMRAWVSSGRVRLGGESGRVGGAVELAAQRATIRVADAGGRGAPAWPEVLGALNIATALLLGRRGRALLHAGAVLGPDGRAWLLVGDSHGGKTSTVVNLIRAGWDWLSDDHVVVAADAEGVRVEGWPRRFNLDDGFGAGTSLGSRTPADPRRFGPGRLVRSAPLGGVLLPRVEAELPTRTEPAHPADALAQLVRQSPWLLADPVAAPGVLALLARMAAGPSARLRLGFDGYRDPALLRDRVAAAVRALKRCEQSP